MDPELSLFALACFFVLLLGAVIRIWRRRYIERGSLSRYNSVRAAGLVIPATLHPVFDPNRCIGSGACTRICPQGDDVIGRIHQRGVLIDPSLCIGHGRCAAECPMGAIRLVFGTSERGVDLPHLRPTFETNIDGLYITGELGGMGLIANAVRQATEGMENIRAALSTNKQNAESTGKDDIADVIVVGAGPAGLTSALFAADRGLSYRLFDKEPEVGGAILSYPRRKIVMTHPVDMPLVGRVHRKTMSKEELLELWKYAVSAHRIRLESGIAVDNITKDENGIFTVTGSDIFARSRTVMLAVGRRGTPRRLNVPGEEGPNVFFGMLEPMTHAKRRVLVVGGGDSAVEAACTLVEETDAIVSLSYRGTVLSKVKAQTLARFNALVAEQKIEPLFQSEVLQIREREILLTEKGETRALPIDDVIVLIGGELPSALLSRIGVQIERHFGEETETHRHEVGLDVFDRIRAQSRAQGLKDFHRVDKGRSPLVTMFVALLCVAAIIALFVIGKDFYLAEESMRKDSEALAVFSATGLFGHTLGVSAALLMLINLAYFTRKELAFMRGRGNIRTWMFVHQASGLFACALVLLHTGLILHNALASALYIGLAAVVSSGITGRYFFSMVPLDPRGRPLTHQALIDLSRRMEIEYRALFGELNAAVEIRKILDLDHRIALSLPKLLLHLFFVWPLRFIRLTRVIRRGKKEISEKAERKSFQRYSIEMFRLRFQMDYAPKLKAILSTWRTAHAVFALLTVFLVVTHIIVEAWVGYKWIF